MNGTTLGNAIGAALYDAIPADIKADMSAKAKAEMCTALQNSWKIAASCIVAHIVGNAEVTVNAGIVLCAPPYPGCTTGPGTGTIA